MQKITQQEFDKAAEEWRTRMDFSKANLSNMFSRVRTGIPEPEERLEPEGKTTQPEFDKVDEEWQNRMDFSRANLSNMFSRVRTGIVQCYDRIRGDR
jgi:hypothetical protein